MHYQDCRLECENNLSSNQKSDLTNFIINYKKNLDIYNQVAIAADIPEILVAAIHWREASGDFTTYLHNGDPLGKPTSHIPKGLFFTEWIPAAVDALDRETLAKKASGISYEETNINDMLIYAEYFNGLGYKKRKLPSPYILAGTTCYIKGKFDNDGDFNSNDVDRQLGILSMLRAIIEI